jgi:hypothetical protein
VEGKSCAEYDASRYVSYGYNECPSIAVRPRVQGEITQYANRLVACRIKAGQFKALIVVAMPVASINIEVEPEHDPSLHKHVQLRVRLSIFVILSACQI